MATGIYQFGAFTLDTAERVLLVDRQPVALAPRALDTLSVLVERHGGVTSKRDLMNLVWPGMFVEEANLAHQVWVLRRAFRVHGGDPRWIQTVSKRGYRFTGPVAAATGRAESGVVATPDARSLAVLPLVNASGDPQLDYLCEGIASSVVTRISALSRLRVISWSAVRPIAAAVDDPRDIGRRLGVGAVLTGEVSRVGSRLTFRVELVDVAGGWQLWGANHDLQTADLLGVQEEIANRIAEGLHVELTREERRQLTKRPTASGEAFRHYLLGRYHWHRRTEETVRRSIVHFQSAIAADPEFALAHAGLADAYSLLGWASLAVLLPVDARSLANAAAVRAVELDPDLAEAHVSVGMVRCMFDWDFDASERNLARAAACNPGSAGVHHMRGVSLMLQRRYPESLLELHQALELDPVAPSVNSDLAWLHFWAGRYQESLAQAQRALELDPSFAWSHLVRAFSYSHQQQYHAALTAASNALRFSGRQFQFLSAYGTILGFAGRHDEAASVVAELMERDAQYGTGACDIAGVLFTIGRRDEGMKLLERGFKLRLTSVLLLRLSTSHHELMRDSRYRVLFKRSGLAT